MTGVDCKLEWLITILSYRKTLRDNPTSVFNSPTFIYDMTPRHTTIMGLHARNIIQYIPWCNHRVKMPLHHATYSQNNTEMTSSLTSFFALVILKRLGNTFFTVFPKLKVVATSCYDETILKILRNGAVRPWQKFANQLAIWWAAHCKRPV